MTHYILQLICISIASVLFTLSSTDTLNFTYNPDLTYSEIIDNVQTSTRKNSSLVANVMIVLKYLLFVSSAILFLAIIVQQYKNCCIRHREYDFLSDYPSEPTMYSNRIITYIFYIAIMTCFVLWLIFISKINNFINGSFALGMYIGVMGIALLFINFIYICHRFFSKKSKKSSGRDLEHEVYVTDF